MQLSKSLSEGDPFDGKSFAFPFKARALCSRCKWATIFATPTLYLLSLSLCRASCPWKHNEPTEIAPLWVKTMRPFACGTARLNCGRDGGVTDELCRLTRTHGDVSLLRAATCYSRDSFAVVRAYSFVRLQIPRLTISFEARLLEVCIIRKP